MARFNGPAPGAGQRAQQGFPQVPRQAAPQQHRPADPYAHDQGLSRYPEAQAYEDGLPPHQPIPQQPDPQGRYAPPYDAYAVPDPRMQPGPQGYPPAASDPYRRQQEPPPFEAPQAYAPPGYEADPYARHEPTFAPAQAAPQPQFQPVGDLRGTVHDQWGQPAGRSAMGYDVGGYESADPGPYAHAQPTHTAAPGWGNDDANYAGEEAAGYGYQMSEAHGGALTEQQDVDDEDYEDEEPRGRGRMMLIAGALVGAIGIGGALAFGYKTFLGSGPEGVPPIVKNDASPSKMKPAEPGGKQFAHTDSKIMGRLSDTGSLTTSATTSANAGDGDSGTRKVQTVVIGRDGSVTAPATQPASVAAPVVTVPGMTVIDGFGATPAARDTQRPVVVNPPAVPPPAEKPVAIAKVATPAPAPTAPQITAVKPAAPVAVKKPVEKKVAAVAPTTTTSAAPAPRASGAGYVSVLSSLPASSSSRMDALKQFADMQQKYSSVLQSKTPDVTEANLGAKGTYHRLVVGPPGSREQASALCGQLKTAGYSGCWVTAY